MLQLEVLHTLDTFKCLRSNRVTFRFFIELQLQIYANCLCAQDWTVLLVVCCSGTRPSFYTMACFHSFGIYFHQRDNWKYSGVAAVGELVLHMV